MNKIYTLGGNSMVWRNEVEELMNLKMVKSTSYVHPPKYELSSKEYFQWFISKISNCDVVILNLDDLDDKTGYEIVAINTINFISSKHIFVVGYGKQTGLPQFIKDVLFHISDTIEDAVDYIVTILMA